MRTATSRNTTDELLDKAADAKRASRVLAQQPTERKNAALRAIAGAVRSHETAILAANEVDCRQAAASGEPVELDRLRLTPERVSAMARDIEAVAGLADPIGQEIDRVVRPNGLVIFRRRVPLGVVGVVYEARPNVTSDLASLCLKTGNAVASAQAAPGSTVAIAGAIHQGLTDAGFRKAACSW